MKNLCFITIASIICLSCSNKPDGYISYDNIKTLPKVITKAEIIDVKRSNPVSEEDFFDLHTSDINFIQLDNKISLGTITKIRRYKERIYILSDGRIYIFKTNGKYLKTIDYKGHGHKEYICLKDFQIIPEEKSIIAVDDLEKKIFTFSLETGKILKVSDEIIGTPFVRKFNGHFYHSVHFNNDWNENETWQLVVTNGKKIVAKQFKMFPISEEADGANNLYEYKDYMNYIPEYSDTIYSLNKDFTYSNKYIVKHDNSLWEKKNEKLSFEDVRNIMKKQKYSYLIADMFFETTKGIVFELEEGQQDGEFIEHYFYDKQKKKTFKIQTGWYGQGINVIFPIQNSFVYNDEIYGYYTDVANYRKMMNPNLISNQKLQKIVKEAKTGDNPVLVSFKIK